MKTDEEEVVMRSVLNHSRRLIMAGLGFISCLAVQPSASPASPEVQRYDVANVEAAWFTANPQELIGVASGDCFLRITLGPSFSAEYGFHGKHYVQGCILPAAWNRVLLKSGKFICCHSMIMANSVRVIPVDDPGAADYVRLPDVEQAYPGRSVTELIATTRFAASDPRVESFRELVAVDVVTKERSILRTLFGGFACGPNGPSMNYVTTEDGEYEVCAMLPTSRTIGWIPKDGGNSKGCYLSPEGDRLAVQTDSRVTFYTIGENIQMGETIDVSQFGTADPRRVDDLVQSLVLLCPPFDQAGIKERAHDFGLELLQKRPVSHVDFSDRLSLVAITIATGETLLLDFNTGSLTGSLDSGADFMVETRFDPSGQYLARIKATCGAEIWDVESQRLVALAPLSPWEAMTLVAPSCTFSPDGETLLIVEPGKAVHLVTGWKE